MVAGSASALTYAWQIFTMPQVIIAQAVAIAALPAFSAMAAQGARDALRASLADTLRGILFLALPATAGLLLLGRPIIAMLFEGRNFNPADTALVAWALAWYTLGLASHSVVEIVSRAYYALHDTRTPVVVGVGAMLLNIALSLLLAPLFTALGWAPHGGLALANTLATSLEMAALMALMRRRLGGLALGRIWPGLARAAAGTALMVLALAGWLRLSAPLAAAWPAYGAWIVGLGGVAVGGAVYAAAAAGMRAPEVALFVSMLRRRG
jgi:putative peptidoglycan lipid II flippase